MQGDRTKILIDSIKRLLRRNALTHLRKIVDKTHAADLSAVFRSLSLSNQHKLFEMIELRLTQAGFQGSLLVVGDFLQLPPVVRGYGEVHYAFESLKIIIACPINQITCDQNKIGMNRIYNRNR